VTCGVTPVSNDIKKVACGVAPVSNDIKKWHVELLL
jgi:hypothetical protein